MLMVASPGHLAAYSLDGAVLWENRPPLQLNLLGCWDFAADGHSELLASSAGYTDGQLFLFDTSNGTMIWSGPPAPGNVGAVKVLNLDSTPALELLWLPAAGSTLYAYTFVSGASRPSLLWSSTIQNFVSDPYTFSSIGVTSPTSGSRKIVISGARHQIPEIVLDAKTGTELGRTVLEVIAGVESGGTGQLLKLADVDGSGMQRIINIASYDSSSPYMFHGLSTANAGQLTDTAFLDTSPVGLRYVQGSVADFDGDGRDEILVSRYLPESDRHDLQLLSARDLTTKKTQPNFYLLGIAVTPDGQVPLILGLTGVTAEYPFGTEGLVAYTYSSGAFHQTSWKSVVAVLATVAARAFDQPDTDNPGNGAIVLPISGGASGVLLLQNGTLVLADARTGAATASFSTSPGVTATLLAVSPKSTPAESRVIVSTNDGSLIFLDGLLQKLAANRIGGYYQSAALNGHSFDVAAVTDLGGGGRNDVIVVDSLNRVFRLSAAAPAQTSPTATLLWSSGDSQELLAVPWAEGGSRMLFRYYGHGASHLTLVDGTGSAVWDRALTLDDDIPIGLNFGHFQDWRHADIVVSCGNDQSFQRSTCTFDGRTGAPIWRSSQGTYWDGTLAVWDFNRDGIDDVVSNFNTYKASVVDGRSGKLLNSPIDLPDYGGLEAVDYNGALLVAGNTATSTDLINGEDDAHLALITVDGTSGKNIPLQTIASWSASQDKPDDQRYSMPAVAPDGKGGFLVGVGSQNGIFSVRRGSDGALLWREFLWNGQAVNGDLALQAYLSSVAAVDINGDGRTEFLVGSIDGWLYALEAETGALLWSMDLGAPVGDPIVADIDGDGFSEILVPVADGYLYAIGPKP
jgi:outer membrane protein assembly factor BamB